MKNGLIIDSKGNRAWFKDDVFHREDGPAIEKVNGDKEWYKHGKLHRDDGPAVINGGSQQWYLNNLRHREDGPAFINNYGHKEWWVNGERHRIDGPAIDAENKKSFWFIHDKKYTKEEFEPIALSMFLQEQLVTNESTTKKHKL